MTLRATPIPLRALMAAMLALAAIALAPGIATAAETAVPAQPAANPPAEGPAVDQPAVPPTEGEEQNGTPVEGESAPPAEGAAPPAEETPPPAEETPTEGEQAEEVVPPPVEETPPPAEEPVVVIEEEVLETEILVIPTTPDAPRLGKTAISKNVVGPPPAPPPPPAKAPPALPTLTAAAPAPAAALPAPTLADTPPALPPPAAPPAAAGSDSEATAGITLVEGIGRFAAPITGAEQSRVGDDIASIADGATPTAAPATDPFAGFQSTVGPGGEQSSLLQVLASYVIPGASGPGSTFQLFLAFALVAGLFGFARPRNWALALPDVPGRPRQGHGSVGLRPG